MTHATTSGYALAVTGTLEMVRLLISAQALTTAFLAVLLWALHVQLRREEFNRWWACAWSLLALFLGVGRLAIAVPASWSATKGAAILIATVAGFLVPPTLVFGAVSLESPGRISRQVAFSWMAIAASLGAISFATSWLWSAAPATAFSVRGVARTLVFAAALFYCSGIFFRRVRARKSWAAMFTGVCCFVYALNQVAYTIAAIAQIYGSMSGAPSGVGRALLWSTRFLYADVAMTCGIVLGMVLLLVEEYQRSERALVETTRSRHEVSEQNTALQLEIRHRQQVEAELAHASRVTAIGALTGSLAHEINQPLAAIRTNAYVALKVLDMAAPNVCAVRDALTDIVNDNKRIDDVVQRLRSLLRKEPRDYRPVDVNAIVSEVLTLVRSNFIERRISIDVRLGSSIPAVLGDRVQLEQVVLNLLMNGADAVDSASAEDRSLTVSTATTATQVSVSIADRGVPVSDAALARMFQPFFTTKVDGMGLGLSICRAIIDAHGGQISARRNSDRGLTCWFVLDRMVPRLDATLAVPASTLGTESQGYGGQTA